MVRVYRNLHKKCYSVQEKVNGRWKVVAHKKLVCLRDVEFRVSQAGRNRVINEKRKNVHAYIVGTEIEPEIYAHYHTYVDGRNSFLVSFKYNPYQNETFVLDSFATPLLDADFVWLDDKKREAIIGLIAKPMPTAADIAAIRA